jgi:hypothetical protein
VPSTSKIMPLSLGAEWVLGAVGERGAKRRGPGPVDRERDMLYLLDVARVEVVFGKTRRGKERS